MKTIGNDLVRHQLHENRKWYLALGVIFIVFGFILLGTLTMATLSIIFLFGILMMLGGVLHIISAFKFFNGGFRWLWAIFGILYMIAGYYAFHSPMNTAIVLTQLLAIFLVIAGIIRSLNAVFYRQHKAWGWTLFSGLLTLLTGGLILASPDAPFWVLGMFLAIDILFQGIHYLKLASYIKHQLPPSSADR